MMRKNQLFLALAAMLILFAAACGAYAPDGGTGGSLEGTAWSLVSLGGQDLLPGTKITASFEGGQVSGSAGCNSYGGAYAVDRSGLRISDVFQTEMACMEPEGVMQQEAQYGQALAQAASFSVDGNRLEIQNAAGETILVFEAGVE